MLSKEIRHIDINKKHYDQKNFVWFVKFLFQKELKEQPVLLNVKINID